ncbi:unnamed protein product [Symbiodinium sp. CCMP2592]|nr:unnamed protein product [Symbiodinium sp. CCMP2592]
MTFPADFPRPDAKKNDARNVFVQMEWVPDMARAVRSVDPLQLDTVEELELEMDKKLRTAWDLLMRGEGFDIGSHSVTQESTLNRSDTLTVGKKVEKLPPPPGEIGAQRLMELLAASFDWDASLRDPAAALAILGRKHDEKLSYTDMVQLLLDGRFRTRDVGRNFVLLSLAEAETLRRILHARLQEGSTILKQSPSSALALRCVFAGNAVLDASKSFQPGPTFQCRMLHQLARFLDGQSFYRPPEISVLLRALQRNRPFDRRRFFEGLGGCRRRGGGAAGGWEQQPVAEVLRPWLEFEQILARVRAVRLHAAIYGQGLSVQMAFQRFDVNQSGLLEPMELCRALRELGFAFDAYEVANWIEAVDTTGNHCADYAEFFAFCKLQVDALLGDSTVPRFAAPSFSRILGKMPPKSILDGGAYDNAATLNAASLTAAAAAGQNGKTYTTVAILEDAGDAEIDVEAVTGLLSAPDATVFITDLQALEGQALNLFSIESGALPGVHKETYNAGAPSLRAQLMQSFGFNLMDGAEFVGPAKLPDVAALAHCKLGSAINSRCTLSDLATGRLMVLLCSLFTIMGAASSLASLTSKKAIGHYTAFSSGQKPQGYSAQAAFFAGAYGTLLGQLPSGVLSGLAGVYVVSSLLTVTLLAEPKHTQLLALLAAAP